MKAYLIVDTVKTKPQILFYDRIGKKWRTDLFYGDINIVLRIGRQMRRWGLELIKFDLQKYHQLKHREEIK